LLEPPLLEFGERRINRVSQGWSSEQGSGVGGYCQRLPLWDALAVIERRTGEQP